MAEITYPLDITGFSPANLVTDELHTLTEINNAPYRTIIPTFAPFYLDNLVVKHVATDGTETILNENADYHLTLPFIGATRSIGKMLYGGINPLNDLIEGTIKVTYQTLGGGWCADANYVLDRLADYVYNPRTAVWDSVTNIQDTFPPINHDQSADYIYGYQTLIDAINALASQIVTTPASSAAIVQYLTETLSKESVGLGKVTNYEIATDVEVSARSPVDKYITLRQVLMLLGG